MNPARPLLRFFAAGAERPRDPAAAADEPRRLRRMQWQVFLSITVGYSFFYTTRLGLSVAKKPLLDLQILSASQLGQLGSALLTCYAIGKVINGVLVDRANLRRFFAAGLLLSALSNVAFGLSGAFPLLLLLWAANGWFQSVGASTSGVSLACWFPARALGTRYAIWSISHNLGEGLTFLGTALLVHRAGWRWAFLGPGLLCVPLALALCRTLADRPQTLGLAPIVTPARPADAAIGAQQRLVLRDGSLWMLGLSSAFLYVVRYALNNWGVLLLQVDKGYGLVEAGFALSFFPVVGALGTVTSGLVSDRLFLGRRAPVSALYGALLILALAAVLWTPGGSRAALLVALSVAGFAIGGQMVLVGGLAALDLCNRRGCPRAGGAALGLIGALSYLGASAQDLLSGHLLGGALAFASVKPLWMGAACLSLLFALPQLRAER